MTYIIIILAGLGILGVLAVVVVATALVNAAIESMDEM